MAVEQGVEDLAERRVAARLQAHLREGAVLEGVALAAEAVLDVGDDRLRLGGAAMRHEPARTFRQPQSHEQDDEAEQGADEEGDAPAGIGAEIGRIEQHHRAGGAHGGADPEAAVDDEIGPAAHARRDKLLDGRVDGRVFAADAGAGQHAEEAEAPDVPGESRGGGADQIDEQGDEEELLAAEPVGQPAEEKRAADGADQIGGAGEAEVDVAELQGRTLLERARERARQRHLEPVEDPGDAERDDEEVMEAPPGQPVEPRRNIRLDHRGRSFTFHVVPQVCMWGTAKT